MNKEKWMQRAAEKGLDAFEIYQSGSRSREVTWFNHQMDTYVTSKTLGTSLRGIVNGKVAYLALETVNDADMDGVLDDLAAQAATITSEDVASLVGPMETEIVSKDTKWITPDMDLVYAVMEDIEKKIMAYDNRFVQVAYLAWNESFGTRSIANSKGLNVADEDGFQALVCSAVVKDGEEIKDDMLIKIVPDLAALDVDAFVKELCDNTLQKLHGRPVESRMYPVILEKQAMTSLFTAFTGLFSGELISKGISPLAGRLHEKIFSDLITIVDDPKHLEAFSVANYDDEGYPTRKKLVVDKGVFETILHSVKSAAKMQMEPTGNGFKSSFASPVSVSPYNMYIQPGTKSLEELEAEMGNGLVITDLAGLHAGIDFVSTNFSLQCSGYKVENGKRTRPVTLVTVASSFMELMNQVQAVGNDLDWKYYTVCAPSIYFKGCAISGE